MRTLIYDIECYPNFFCLVTYDIDSKNYQHYSLDQSLLFDIILNEKIILIGWNNHSYDDLLLSYIKQHTRTIWVKNQLTYKILITTKDLHELSQEIITSPEITQQVKQLRYCDKQYYSIDIKSLLDPMPGLKKLELRTQFHNIQDLPFDPNKNVKNKDRPLLHKYCQNDVAATFKIYKDHAVKHMALRQFLADEFEILIEKIESASEPRTAEYILSNKALKSQNKQPWQIRNNLAPISEVIVQDCIPDWIMFTTPDLQQELTALKEIVLPINATGYVSGVKLKRKIKIANREYQLGIGGLHSLDKPGSYHSTSTHQLIDADVTSYYPSILLRDGLSPRGYDHKWQLAYREIYTNRLNSKNNIPKLTEQIRQLKKQLNNLPKEVE